MHIDVGLQLKVFFLQIDKAPCLLLLGSRLSKLHNSQKMGCLRGTTYFPVHKIYLDEIGTEGLHLTCECTISLLVLRLFNFLVHDDLGYVDTKRLCAGHP